MPFVATIEMPEAAARATSDAIGADELLAERSCGLHEISDGRWQVSVYFERAPDADESAALARTLETTANRSRFRIAALPDADWVAQSLAALAPVRAGRFLIHGSHDRHRASPNDIAIEIDAGAAFGTGHHGTTAACLTAIDQVARSHIVRSALDVGTGSGILAIAIAKRTKARVAASDIDPAAVALARDNARLNGVARLVTTVVADGLRASTIRKRAPYDLIVANILAGPLIALAPAIRRNLAPGGTAILSGLLTSQARRVAAIYRGLGMRRAGLIVMGEWATLILRG